MKCAVPDCDNEAGKHSTRLIKYCSRECADDMRRMKQNVKYHETKHLRKREDSNVTTSSNVQPCKDSAARGSAEASRLTAEIIMSWGAGLSKIAGDSSHAS